MSSLLCFGVGGRNRLRAAGRKVTGDENHYARYACKRQSICVRAAVKVKRFVELFRPRQRD